MERARAKDIFAAVTEAPEAERSEMLSRLCAGDAQLRTEVEDLLTAHGKLNRFLASPSMETIAPKQAPARIATGTMIGRYKLLEVLGEGGFGLVYMAEQREPVFRRVAVKVIKPGMDSRQVIARFEQERQALAMMDHPNIAQVLDAGESESGLPYFVMELVRGVPLAAYCDKEKMPIRDRLSIFCQVCRAVQHAHMKGVIHRDIKPANILVSTVDGRPVPKVIDFGIAKAVSAPLTDKTLFTEFRQFIGTPEYMSPEQATSGGNDVDTRTDTYSLGVLLYELLTGSTPFDPAELRRAGLFEIQRIIREVDPPRPSTRLGTMRETAPSVAAMRATEPGTLTVSLRGDLDWIVMRCLEKDRARRYETPGHLADDIERYMTGNAVLAAPPSVAYRMQKFVSRNRLGVAVGGIVVGAVLVGVSGLAWGLVRAMRAGESERAQRSLAEEEAKRANEEAKRADGQAALAKRKALAADSAVHMIGEILSTADRAEQGGNAAVTVREVMDRAAAKLDRDSNGVPPEVDASVRDVISQTYKSLAEYEAAQHHAQRAVELRRAANADPMDLARSLSGLASVQVQRGDYKEADATLNEAIRIARETEGDESETLVDIQAQMAELLDRSGLAQQSIEMRRQILAERRRTKPAFDPAIGTALNDLGNSLVDVDAAEATRLLTESLDIARRNHGAEHMTVSRTLSTLATLLTDAGKADEALPMLREALAIREKLLGPDHADLVPVLNNIASAERRRYLLSDAEQHVRRAIRIVLASYGKEHDYYAVLLNTLSTILEQAGDLEGSIGACRESLEIAERTLGAENPGVAIMSHNLARVLMDAGKPGEAAPLMERAIGILRVRPGVESTQYVQVLVGAGHTRYMNGDVAGAEASYAALSTLIAPLPPKSDRRAMYLLQVGLERTLQGKYSDAERLLREAVAIRDEIIVDGAPNTSQKHIARGVLGFALVGCAADALHTRAAAGEEGERAVLLERAKKLLTEAEGLLLPAWSVLEKEPRIWGAGGLGDRRRPVWEGIARLHEVKAIAEPGAGHAERGAAWRAKPLPVRVISPESR